tara:strand:- start:18085 stop:18552 length:468 start_codon:yes stop_codon:yes gene_type:complete
MKDFHYDGQHLLIDAVCKKTDTLNDSNLIVDCLEEIVNSIGMTMILPPVTVKFPHTFSEIDKIYEDLKKEGLGGSQTAKRICEDLSNRKNQTYGYSSFVVIAESHISIHTFPEANFFSFDCYSCNKFDHHKVVMCLEKYFDIDKSSINVVERKLP